MNETISERLRAHFSIGFRSLLTGKNALSSIPLPTLSSIKSYPPKSASITKFGPSARTRDGNRALGRPAARTCKARTASWRRL